MKSVYIYMKKEILVVKMCSIWTQVWQCSTHKHIHTHTRAHTHTNYMHVMGQYLKYRYTYIKGYICMGKTYANPTKYWWYGTHMHTRTHARTHAHTHTILILWANIWNVFIVHRCAHARIHVYTHKHTLYLYCGLIYGIYS